MREHDGNTGNVNPLGLVQELDDLLVVAASCDVFLFLKLLFSPIPFSFTLLFLILHVTDFIFAYTGLWLCGKSATPVFLIDSYLFFRFFPFPVHMTSQSGDEQITHGPLKWVREGGINRTWDPLVPRLHRKEKSGDQSGGGRRAAESK